MFQALQPELYLLPIMDHLGNVYSASTVTIDERQSNNDVAEVDGTVLRPVSVTLSKEESGRDPSLLENTLKELLNRNQEEGELYQYERKRLLQYTLPVKSVRTFWTNLALQIEAKEK